MPSCYILIADQPYEKVIFLRLTKQIKDQLSVFAINTSIRCRAGQLLILKQCYFDLILQILSNVKVRQKRD